MTVALMGLLSLIAFCKSLSPGQLVGPSVSRFPFGPTAEAALPVEIITPSSNGNEVPEALKSSVDT